MMTMMMMMMFCKFNIVYCM